LAQRQNEVFLCNIQGRMQRQGTMKIVLHIIVRGLLLGGGMGNIEYLCCLSIQ